METCRSVIDSEKTDTDLGVLEYGAEEPLACLQRLLARLRSVMSSVKVATYCGFPAVSRMSVEPPVGNDDAAVAVNEALLPFALPRLPSRSSAYRAASRARSSG